MPGGLPCLSVVGIMQVGIIGEERWDEASSTPYLRWKGGDPPPTIFELWYDNARSLSLKAEFAKSVGAGGVSMWNGDTLDYQNASEVAAFWGSFKPFTTPRGAPALPDAARAPTVEKTDDERPDGVGPALPPPPGRAIGFRNRFSAIARKTDDTGGRSLAAQREYWPTKAWRKAPPAAQGFNASALAEAARYLRTTNQKSWDKKIGNNTWLTRHIDAFLVVRGGFVVHEQYWTPNGRKGVPHDVASATKSIAWMALAHAAMQGKLSLETRVDHFFPNLASDPPCKLVMLSRFVCCPSR